MGLGSRQARLHQTTAAQKQAMDTTVYADFKPEQRVMTVDGVPGVVTAVLDGPVPGWEAYEVKLDNGLGGGQYTASQLRAAEYVTAGEHHTADQDYPELGTILQDRPDPAQRRRTASLSPDERLFHRFDHLGPMDAPKPAQEEEPDPETARHVDQFRRDMSTPAATSHGGWGSEDQVEDLFRRFER